MLRLPERIPIAHCVRELNVDPRKKYRHRAIIMDDEKDFSDANPFLALDRSRFPDVSGAEKTPSRQASTSCGTPGASGKASRHPAPPPENTAGEGDDADSRLFLAAVGAAARPADKKQGQRPQSFRLEEQASFRNILHDSPSPAPKSRARRAAERKISAPRVPELSDTEASASPASPPVPLSEEETAFARAMRDVAPLSGKGRAVVPETPPPAPPAQAEISLQDFMDGKLEFALSLTGEYLEGHVVGLDETTMNKLRAGRYSPEAHLDLHGLNAMQAFQALLGFFRNAWHKGLRTVLVVPGRGRNSPDGIGVLRDKLQFWLTEEPFKRIVLAFCTAKPADGGAGSVYILLRKYRKKGKIYWERTPADPDLF